MDDSHATIIEAILKELLSALGASFKGVTRTEVAGQTIFTIETDDARTLIGAHGDTIHPLDMLVKKILEKRQPVAEGADSPMFLVDINDYRAKEIKDFHTKSLI